MWKGAPSTQTTESVRMTLRGLQRCVSQFHRSFMHTYHLCVCTVWHTKTNSKRGDTESVSYRRDQPCPLRAKFQKQPPFEQQSDPAYTASSSFRSPSHLNKYNDESRCRDVTNFANIRECECQLSCMGRPVRI